MKRVGRCLFYVTGVLLGAYLMVELGTEVLTQYEMARLGVTMRRDIYDGPGMFWTTLMWLIPELVLGGGSGALAVRSILRWKDRQ